MSTVGINTHYQQRDVRFSRQTSSSLATEWVSKTVAEALAISNTDIVKEPRTAQ